MAALTPTQSLARQLAAAYLLARSPEERRLARLAYSDLLEEVGEPSLAKQARESGWIGRPTRTVVSMGRREREATPPAFAEWLVELARRARGANHDTP